MSDLIIIILMFKQHKKVILQTMKSECKLHNGTDLDGYSWTDTSSQTIRITNLFDKKDSGNCQILTPSSIFKFN